MATYNILAIADEVESVIAGLDVSYHDEFQDVAFRLPTGGRTGDFRGQPARLGSAKETRIFSVVPGKGHRFGRWNGTEAPVITRITVAIRYFIPPHDMASWRRVHRMAARDSEVIVHELESRSWTALNAAPMTFVSSNELEEIGDDGLHLLLLIFDADYHYDGS